MGGRNVTEYHLDHDRTISNVKLEYSTDGFLDELKTVLITASAPNTNSYAWTIPNAIGSSVKVRVTNVADSTVLAVSSANFTIRGALTITSPNGERSGLWSSAQYHLDRDRFYCQCEITIFHRRFLGRASNLFNHWLQHLLPL